jgi:hypothetical protein
MTQSIKNTFNTSTKERGWSACKGTEYKNRNNARLKNISDEKR